MNSQKFEMQSNSNFLPNINQFDAPRSPRSPLNNHNHNSNTDNNNNGKLENRIFYVEKAVARLIHAFESIGGRMNKLEADNSTNNGNIATLSKAVKEVTDSNKEFVSKQHLITERLVTDIHKQQHQFTQQTAFINKELSDVRDSLQILSTNLQKNFNESIKAAIQQCNDLNVQNSNNLTSLRKITDQKISHLQQLMVEMQKRAQTQNSSILDIINSNQKNQTEFQQSFKLFFEKYRDSMHANLTSLQESTQEQISYLDNILRAEIKGRISATQDTQKQMDAKVFELQEIINQHQRDSKRSWEYINKSLESVQETQKHQSTANQPLHKIITNLTQQFDEMSQQQLTDIKSVMHLNQDTAEKQFAQIKNLQLQIQHIYSKLAGQENQMNNPAGAAVTFSPPRVSYATMKQVQMMERPQSYRSDMSSTAAFNAIKYHLSTMPHKAEDAEDADADDGDEQADHQDFEVDDYMQQQSTHARADIESPQVQRQYSQFQQLSEQASPVQQPVPTRPEQMPASMPAEQSQSEQQYEDEFGADLELENTQNNENNYDENGTVSAANEQEIENIVTEQNDESNLEKEKAAENIENVENDEYEQEQDQEQDEEEDEYADENAESEKVQNTADNDEENATNEYDLDIDDMLQDNEDIQQNDDDDANELESPQNADIYDGDENDEDATPIATADEANTEDVQQQEVQQNETLSNDALDTNTSERAANDGNDNYSEEYGDGDDKFEEDANSSHENKNAANDAEKTEATESEQL